MVRLSEAVAFMVEKKSRFVKIETGFLHWQRLSDITNTLEKTQFAFFQPAGIARWLYAPHTYVDYEVRTKAASAASYGGSPPQASKESF